MGTTGLTVRITHPFHPLAGEALELISRGQHWGEDRVIYRAPDGTLPTIAAALTDLDAPDAFQRIAAGRAAFRTVDLVRLSAFLAEVAAAMGGDNE